MTGANLPRGQFRVWCEVSGGVTGHRAAWLKRNGAIATFDTLEQAEAHAAELRQSVRHCTTGARFIYRAERYQTEPS